jgi:apolipoprotein N-acyltransferase
MTGWRGPLAVAAGAVALAAALPKFDLHLLSWVALAPLLFSAAGATPWRAWQLGFFYGLVFRAASLYWVVHAMTVHGGLSTPVAILGAALLWAYLAAFVGLFALVVQQTGIRAWPAPLLLAAVWAGLEYLQGWFLTGFPWTFVGYAIAPVGPLLQLADLTGVYGLSFLVVLTNATVAGCWAHQAMRRRQLLVVIGVLAFAFGYGAWRLGTATAADQKLTVGLVQGNVAQDVKWDIDARREILQRHIALTEEAARRGATVVIWPESSWPDPYGIERDPAAYEPVAAAAARYGIDVVVGTVRVQAGDDGYDVANGAVRIDPTGQLAGAYEKTHLVPFGEYLPFRSVLNRLGPLVQAVGELRAGDADQPLLGGDAALPSFGLAICYEVIFPHIPARQVAAGARFLATITNDAWYGTTAGPYQHFAMARVRAVEHRRWLVRSANTGISGVIDPWGRVVEATPLEEPAVVVAEIGLRDDLTPYSRLGDAFGLICQLLAVVATAGALRGRALLQLPPAGPTPTPSADSE